jgi:hypothetical protein
MDRKEGGSMQRGHGELVGAMGKYAELGEAKQVGEGMWRKVGGGRES